MRKRVPQPPMDPEKRALEVHDFWAPFAVAIVSVLLIVCGAGHATSVETTDEDVASEVQLVKAFSCGGLKYPNHEPPPPPKLEGEENPAEAMERWARQQANAEKPTWKLRVDVGAKTPCPT